VPPLDGAKIAVFDIPVFRGFKKEAKSKIHYILSFRLRIKSTPFGIKISRQYEHLVHSESFYAVISEISLQGMKSVFLI